VSFVQRGLLALIAAIGPVLNLAQASQDTPRPTSNGPSTVALVETWPDGRTIAELTTAKRAVMWTPVFPRIDGYKPAANTKPVYAVQFARVLLDGHIRVDVSVLLGSATPPGVPVATVMVTHGRPITIDELSKFGVRPVTLSMVDVVPFRPYLPSVVSVSPNIEVEDVELLTAPYPGYRITLRNLGPKAASTIHVQSYRGQDRSLSALKRSDDGRPMMPPGGSYTFDVNLTSIMIGDIVDPQAWAPVPLDVIDLDAIRWDDGTYDGTPRYPQIDAVVEGDSGRRLQLRRIIDRVKRCLADQATGPDLIASVKEAVSTLPDSEPDQVPSARSAMERTKATVVADLLRYDSTQHADVAAADWLTELVRRYEGWLARISPP
jgi:hypothetical protein